MGGEKWSVLMFGPRIKMDIADLIRLLESNGKKYTVKNYPNSHYAYLSDKIDTDYTQDSKSNSNSESDSDEESDSDDKFDKILDKYNLNWSYESVDDWYRGICCIGYQDNDNDNDSDGEFPESSKKEEMKIFCKKFSLPPPKIFAGMVGELE